jgi:putative glycosyltransferase (TIGR04372 family)
MIDQDRGWQSLTAFGVRPGEWFVGLHVREQGWKDNGSRAEEFRNADIKDYIPAIQAVTDAGGWVVRMGDATMKPLPPMPRVIDYVHSSAKSDWMDIFLCAASRFFIATSSGPYTVAMAFGTPVVATNFLPTCCAYYMTSQDIFIPRLCKLKQTGDWVNFSELFSPRFGTAAVQSIYDDENIEAVSNTQQDIKDVVGEMLDRCSGSLRYTEEDESLQSAFWKVGAACGRQYGPEHTVIHARMGRNFLKTHSGLLPSQRDVHAGVQC